MKVIGPMFPIRTPDAGNSLVNAASLGIWGVEDTEISILSPHDKSQVRRMRLLQRSGIAKFMVQSDNANLLKLYLRAGERRFLASIDAAQSTTAVTGGQRIVDIITSDASLDAAYDQLLSDAEANDIPLSSFHIYVLANALKRPIIVYGDPLTAQNRMRGIYLPTMYVRKVNVGSHHLSAASIVHRLARIVFLGVRPRFITYIYAMPIFLHDVLPACLSCTMFLAR
jgi:hypothetical protein